MGEGEFEVELFERDLERQGPTEAVFQPARTAGFRLRRAETASAWRAHARTRNHVTMAGK